MLLTKQRFQRRGMVEYGVRSYDLKHASILIIVCKAKCEHYQLCFFFVKYRGFTESAANELYATTGGRISVDRQRPMRM